MACKGWKNGCTCDKCLRLHGILTDPSLSSKEERENAEKRLWTKKPEDRKKKQKYPP